MDIKFSIAADEQRKNSNGIKTYKKQLNAVYGY